MEGAMGVSKIAQIDKNFAAEKLVEEGEKAYYSLPHPDFSLYGVRYDEERKRFVRMDVSVAEKVSEVLSQLAQRASGGRIAFATDSTLLTISATYEDFCNMPHMPLSGSSGFSLFEEGEDGWRFVKSFAPQPWETNAFTAETALQGGRMRKYLLYFPLYNEVNTLSIGLTKGAGVQRIYPYREIAPILYYGSSITQGGCASRPDTCYPAIISKKNAIDYINLGFSGNAKGETIIAEYLAGIDCSLFVCDYDHNAPSTDYLQNTHYAFYERYRALRPHTPILFLTKPDLDGGEEGKEREQIIRATYKKAKKAGDKRVYFLSGRHFYKGEDRGVFSVDGCHPTDFGFQRMAAEIYKKIIKIDKKFRG